MNHFHYRNGVLHAEDVSLARLAEEVGTPFYCYSTATLTRHFEVFRAPFPADSLIAYSVKANGNLAVLKTLAQLGAGADVVSGGELKRALAAGVPAGRIVFSGVGKTKDEMRSALDAGIYQFNVESEPELEALNEVASGAGRRAPTTIRVNPDVDAKTHAKIATGAAETKFGVPWRQALDIYARARELPGIEIVGVDVHIGSQITELAPFEGAFKRLKELIVTLRGAGHRISRADLGGGLGVPYRQDDTPPDPETYGTTVARLMRGLDVRLILEPGRLIAANAGVLVARVIYVKAGEAKTFVVLDAGMNDLIRPALYDAYHEILPVAEPRVGVGRKVYDVVGPVCETADLFARDRDLPVVNPDDLMALMSAGAYGAVMASAYNTRPLTPEVLVKGREWFVARPRLTNEVLIALDRLPDWLS